jgi:hypothetical protein
VHVALAALLALRGFAPELGEGTHEVVAPVVDLAWDAPPECGSRDEFIADIEALLGRPLGQPDDPDLEVVARISTEVDGVVLVLEFGRPVERARELRGASCAELRDAAAVVLAVTIDPFVPLNEPEPVEPEPVEPEPVEPMPVAEPVAEPIPVAEPEPVAEPLPAKPRELTVLLRLAGGVEYRALPTLAGGPSLALGLRWRALRAELVGSFWLSAAKRFDAAPDVGATISLGWVAPRLCGVPAVGRVSFPLCVGIELGGMRAAAFGTSDARARTLAWIAPQLGAAVHLHLSGPLALWVGVDAAIPVVRPSFTIAGLGELHRGPPFAFQGILGLEIRFDAGGTTDSRAGGQGLGT